TISYPTKIGTYMFIISTIPSPQWYFYILGWQDFSSFHLLNHPIISNLKIIFFQVFLFFRVTIKLTFTFQLLIYTIWLYGPDNHKITLISLTISTILELIPLT